MRIDTFRKLTTVVLLAFSPALYAGPLCATLHKQLANAFADIHGNISESDQMQFTLLQTCAKRHNLCIVVQAPSPKWFDIVSADTRQAVVKMDKGQRAVSSLSSVRSRQDRKLCVLSRFGGGTASVWTIDAWENKDGVVRTLDTDMVELHGESKTPTELIREVENAARKIN